MLRNEKICVEKVSQHSQNQLRAIKVVAGGTVAGGDAQAAFLKANIWPQKTQIKVSFGSYEDAVKRGSSFFNAVSNLTAPIDPLADFVQNEKNPIVSIKKVIDERIQKLVNLRFVYMDKFEEGDIRIAFNDDGAWSYIGTDVKNTKYAGQPTMNLGWIDAPTILHEFGHALGLIHEHSNPSGGISWNVPKVEAWAKETQGWDKETTDENIIKKYDKDQINGSEFDPDSIMLYFFPANLTENNCCGTHMNCRLSRTDVQWIWNKYGIGAEMTPKEFYPYAYKEPFDTKGEAYDKGEAYSSRKRNHWYMEKYCSRSMSMTPT